MRRFLVALCLAIPTIGLAGSVMAAEPVGPSGSTFSGTVVCGHTNTFLDSPVVLYNGYNGLEVCSEELGTRVWVQSNYKKPIFLPDYIHADVNNMHVLHLNLPF